MSRILSMNEYYIKNIDESELYKNFVEYCEIYKEKINPEKEVKIKLSLSFLKNKAKTLEDIYNNAKYIVSDEIIVQDEDLKLIDEKAKKIIKEFKDNLENIDDLNRENLEPIVNKLIKNYETNFKGIGQPLRVALTGSKFGPGLYDIVISLGKEEVKKRLESEILI
jgi:glutamyl-tRNA synthetase